jgi:uncharacterized membrane protein YfcA
MGVLTKQPALPADLGYWAVVVLLGGLIGAEFGSRRLPNYAVRIALALVLVFAGGKMLWEGLMLASAG